MVITSSTVVLALILIESTSKYIDYLYILLLLIFFIFYFYYVLVERASIQIELLLDYVYDHTVVCIYDVLLLYFFYYYFFFTIFVVVIVEIIFFYIIATTILGLRFFFFTNKTWREDSRPLFLDMPIFSTLV